MDIGAFAQENRRWLVGCAIGLVVFFIAYGVIGSIFDPSSAGGGVAARIRTLPEKMYSSAQVDELISEQEVLVEERARLSRMLAFERGPRFQVQTGVKPDEVLFEVGRDLKTGILNGANERDVQVNDKQITWTVANGHDEINKVLFGLELIDETIKRLFAAHDKVRDRDEEAMGLRSVLQLGTELQKGGRRPFPRGGRDAVDLQDLVEQERVSFKFEADAETINEFFESCRQTGRTLVVERVLMLQPERINDPVVITGSLVGIAFKKAGEQP